MQVLIFNNLTVKREWDIAIYDSPLNNNSRDKCVILKHLLLNVMKVRLIVANNTRDRTTSNINDVSHILQMVFVVFLTAFVTHPNMHYVLFPAGDF